MISQRHLHVLYLLFLMLSGLFARFHHVDIYGYGSDSVGHMQIAGGQTLNEVWQFSRNETHPPIGHFIRHLWLKISDNTEWARSLSILSDMGLIAAFFFLGNRVYPGIGLIAATLAAFSPGFITLSQEIRNYSLFSLFFTCCLYFYFRFIATKAYKWLMFYTAFGCLALGTHFGGIIPIFAITLVSIPLLYKEKKLCLRWLLANSLIGGVFLFFYLAQHWTLSEYLLPALIKPPFTLFNISQILLGLILYPSYVLLYLPEDMQAHVNSVLFLFFMASIEVARQKQPLLFKILLFSLLIWGSLCFTSLYTAHKRHNIWIAPFIILTASIVLRQFYDKLPLIFLKKSIALCCISALAAYSLLRSDIYPIEYERIKKNDIVAIQHYIATYAQPGDAIVAGRASMAMLYFYLLKDNYYRHIPALKEKSTPPLLLKTESSAGLSFISTPFHYVIQPSNLFISFFENATKNGWLDHANTIWFYSIMNTREVIAEHLLLQCPALQPEITHRFISDSYGTLLLFSLKKTALMDLISPQGKYYHCLQTLPAANHR